jgi:hypothetical protein
MSAAEVPPIPDLDPPAMPPKLAAKLWRVHADIQPVPKAGYNDDHHYWYQRAGDVAQAARASMAKHGLLLLWQPQGIEWREYQTASNKTMREATVWYLATFFDGESGEEYSIRWPGVAMDLQDKVLAKCATAAQKTFLITQFQIPDDGEDTDEGSGPDRADRPPRREAPPRRQEQPRQQDGEKLTGTITKFERKGAGAHVTVKDQRVWAGPIMAKKFPDDAVGKGCALVIIQRENREGKYYEVVSVLSVADKVMSAAEMSPPAEKAPPAGAPAEKKQELSDDRPPIQQKFYDKEDKKS